MKKTLSFELIYRLVDVTTMLTILLVSTYVYSGTYNLDGYLLAGLLAVLLFGLVGRFLDIYTTWQARAFLKDEAVRVMMAWLITFMILIFVAFASKTSDSFSRFILILWLFITPVVLISNRYLLRKLFKQLLHLGFNNHRIVIVGLTEHGQQFANQIQNNTDSGFQLAGFYDDEHNTHHQHGKVLGDLSALINAAKLGTWDAIYIALPLEARQKTMTLLEQLSESITPIRLIPDYFTSALLKTKYRELANTPVLYIHETPLKAHNILIKRLEDIVLSSLILVLISPLMLVLAIAVKLTSKGPILFKQTRNGRRGEMFTVYKFRSMTVCEDGAHIRQASRNDHRLTNIGHFIRCTSLDELPQFINVLKGDMSIVGPRPHAVTHNEHYKQLIPGYTLRHMIKPGITGWAQVNGWRGETDTLQKMEKRIEHDLDYIRRWSLWLDIKIILISMVRGFSSKNAY